jgi:4-hydroxy-L-threonine phosphate dehydrogenase PdxA
MGKVSPEAGRACVTYATEAMRAGLGGSCDAVVAAPHTEAAVNAAGIKFSGYPELLAEVTGTPASDVFLMLVSPQYRVVNVTLHEPLRTAIARLDADLIERAIGAGLDAMARFGVARPKIGVCGLNPHAGEGGLFGEEDRAIISPAVARWQAKGADVSGPHPADALFAKRAHDVYVAMYHDQGHIPVKTASPHLGIAVSVGTPVLFASVAHGSAHDIAGQGRADEGALASALLTLAGQFKVMAFALALFAAAPASAQSVSQRQNMAFGTIGGDFNLTGTVTVTPSGTKTVAGGANNFGGTHRAAQFRITGTSNREVAITLPTSFNITVSGKTMTVNNLTHDCANPCKIASNGRRDFNVGGRLNLAANQGAGNYTGNLTVTVVYN